MNLRRLIATSVVYMAIGFMGAIVAIRENRPSDPGGWSTGLPALQDFLYGNGTALSPPLYMLIAVAIFAMLAHRPDRWGGLGVGGLTVAGLLFGIGASVEPILFEIFNPAMFDWFKAVIEIGLITVPVLMMVFGIREWARRRRNH